MRVVTWAISTPEKDYELTTWRTYPPAAVGYEALAMVASCARQAIEARDSQALSFAQTAFCEKERFRTPVAPRDMSWLQVAELASWMQRAVVRGIVAVAEVAPLAGISRLAAEPSEAPVGAKTRETLTWFAVKVVDEVGEVVSGVNLVFSHGGKDDKRPTDGSGVARLADVPEGVASVRFDDEAALRSTLHGRWAKARKKPWITRKPDPTTSTGTAGGTAPASPSTGPAAPASPSTTTPDPEPPRTVMTVRHAEKLAGTTITAEEPHTIVLCPRVVRARMHGLYFDTSKCFLLPDAIPSMKGLCDIYKANEKTALLVVGHTDPRGSDSYNETLSLERARSVAAYLKSDVAAWMAWYDGGKPAEKRWGDIEDSLMAQAMATEWGETIPDGTSAVAWYMARQGLSGASKSDVRQALVTDYLNISETTLPTEIPVSTHGCGKYFPETETPDITLRSERCVDLFFFEDTALLPDSSSETVLPKPPGDISKKGTDTYPEWCLRARESERVIDFEVVQHRVRLCDFEGYPLPNAPFRVVQGAQSRQGVADGDGYAAFGTLGRPDCVTLAWRPTTYLDGYEYPYQQQVFVADLDDASGDDRRLANLNFSDTSREANVSAFQLQFGHAVATGQIDDIRDDLRAYHDGGPRPA